MLIDIEELLDDEDFIQSVTFEVVTQSTTSNGDPLEAIST